MMSPCAAAMPSSASLTTLSGALMSFFIEISRLSDQRVDEESRDHGADQRTDDRNPGISPIAAALAGNWQHGMGNARAEVTRRIDGVACRAAERQSDAEHEPAYEQGA